MMNSIMGCKVIRLATIQAAFIGHKAGLAVNILTHKLADIDLGGATNAE